MRAIVSERQLRSAIERILREGHLILEADEVPEFPAELYREIKSAIKSTGASSGDAAVGLAAIFLNRGNEKGFIELIIASNPSIYPYFYKGIFQPVAGTPLKSETPTTRVGVPPPDYEKLFVNLASALGYMGRSSLEPVLRRTIDEMKSAHEKGVAYTFSLFTNKDAFSVKQFLESQTKNQEGSKGQSPTGVKSARIIPEFLGKRFSYEVEGTPELTVIAKLKGSDRDFIAKVYEPTATVLDPVTSKKGVLLSFEVFKNIKAELYDWESRFVNIEEEIQAEISRSANVGSIGTVGAGLVGERLYEKYKIFVPTVAIYPPISESTEYAYQKSLSFGCTLEKGELVKQLAQYFAAVGTRATPLISATTDTLGVQPDYPDMDRLIPCIKDYTADSFIYGIVNTIVGYLGPWGAVAGVAMDLVPGILLTCYFFKKGQKELAITYMLYTVVSVLSPVAIGSFAKKINKAVSAAAPDPDSLAILKSETAVNILLGIPIAVPLAIVINKISSLFGDGTVYSNDQVTEFIESAAGDKTADQILKEARDKVKELTVEGVLDPQGLRAKYPAVY